MKGILRRLSALEPMLPKRAPTFEEFKKEWETFDELSRALYITMAECPDLMGGCTTPYESKAVEYLRRMGLVNNETKSFNDVLNEMEDVDND